MGHVQDRWFTTVKDPNNPKKTIQQPTSRCGVGKRYRARVIGPDGGEISESFADGQDKAAQEWINTTEAKITLGIYEAPQTSKKSNGMPLLKPFASDYIAHHDMDEASREVLEMRFGKHIFPHLGEKPLDEINASALRSWDSKLRKDKLSDQYRHTLFMNLSAVMNAAVDDEVIPKNPCEGKSVKKPKPTKKKVVPWPAARVSAVRKGLPERFRVGVDLGTGSACARVSASAWRWRTSTAKSMKCTSSGNSRRCGTRSSSRCQRTRRPALFRWRITSNARLTNTWSCSRRSGSHCRGRRQTVRS